MSVLRGEVEQDAIAECRLVHAKHLKDAGGAVEDVGLAPGFHMEPNLAARGVFSIGNGGPNGLPVGIAEEVPCRHQDPKSTAGAASEPATDSK